MSPQRSSSRPAETAPGGATRQASQRLRGESDSGKTNRHRLNRGGDRQASAALHTVALVRTRSDPRTRAYPARRTTEGLSRIEIMRCIKRYIAREFCPLS